MDPDLTPDAADDAAQPVVTRRTPAPRPAARTADDRSRTAELRTGEVDADPRPVRGHPTGADQRPPDARTVDVRGERPAMAEPTVPTNIYRARRPVVAVFLVIPAVAVGLLLIRGLAIAAFGPTFLIGGVIATALALASLPLLVAGLYGLITGAAHGSEQWGFKVWARPPLAYLVVGLVFVLAAGLAIR